MFRPDLQSVSNGDAALIQLLDRLDSRSLSSHLWIVEATTSLHFGPANRLSSSTSTAMVLESHCSTFTELLFLS